MSIHYTHINNYIHMHPSTCKKAFLQHDRTLDPPRGAMQESTTASPSSFFQHSAGGTVKFKF